MTAGNRATLKIHFLVPHAQDEAPGQRLKFEHYYGLFRQEGYEVIHDAFYTPALYRRLSRPGLVGKVLGLAWACLKRLRSLWTAWRSDVVYLFLEAIPAGPPVLEWIIVKVLRRPMIYDIDDLIYLKKPGSRDPFPTFFDRKRKVEFFMRSAEYVMVATPHLEKEARRHNDRVITVTLAIDTDRYSPKTAYDVPVVTVGWSGSFSTSQYLHLLDNVLRVLQQRYGVNIRVIGDAGFSIPGVQVEALPWRLDSEVEDLRKIDIGLYPLPHEEWVLGKSGGKALQYMGLGIPTVMTPIGVNLEIVEHGKNGFFADSEEEWTDALTELIQDPTLRERVGKAGRVTVEERCSVAVNWPLYREAVRGVLGFGQPERPARPEMGGSL